MKNIILMLFSMFLASCSCRDEKNSDPKTTSEISASNSTNISSQKQLNISILIDLSDRISPKENPSSPEHSEKDLEIVKHISQIFVDSMKEKGVFMSKGKIKVFFHPQPKDPNLNDLAKKLIVDLSKMTNEKKKEVYDNLVDNFNSSLRSIYQTTIQNNNYPGSDIWRFFKDDTDLVVESDTNYRNILILLTDGYIYHEDSRQAQNNRHAYILPSLLNKYKLRNNDSWKNEIDSKDFGLINTNNNLNNLEVLVLEVNPEKQHPNDYEILEYLISKWLTEMGISKSKSKVYRTNLPEYTKSRINNFLGND